MNSRLFRLIEPKMSLDDRQKIFSNAALMQIIIPLFFEQLLTMTVGIADTFMISYAGDAAVSGVSRSMPPRCAAIGWYGPRCSCTVFTPENGRIFKSSRKGRSVCGSELPLLQHAGNDL